MIDVRSVRLRRAHEVMLDRMNRDRSIADRRRNVVARLRTENFSPPLDERSVISITGGERPTVIQIERSVIPSERSESRDLHFRLVAPGSKRVRLLNVQVTLTPLKVRSRDLSAPLRILHGLALGELPQGPPMHSLDAAARNG